MLDVHSYKGSSTTIPYRNISNSVCELNSTNISCQIWTASLMTKTLLLWQKLHTNTFIMSNYYKNLSMMKPIDETDFLRLKLHALFLKYLDTTKEETRPFTLLLL